MSAGTILALLEFVKTLAGQIGATSALISQMKSEGRETLTDDEWAAIQTSDDTARAALVAAIAQAQAEGR